MPPMIHQLRALQSRLGPFWWHSAIMFGVSRIGDVLHVIIGVFLVPMYVAADQLGAVLPLISLGAFFSVPLRAAAKTTARYITEFRVAEEKGRIRNILRDLMALSALVSLTGILVIWIGHPFFAARLHFEGRAIPLLLTGLIILSCWKPILSLTNQGLGEYYRITAAVLVRAFSRIVLAVILLPLWGLEGYLAMQLLTGVAVSLFLIRGFRQYFRPAVHAVSNRELLAKVNRYFMPMLLMTAILAFKALMEPWIIRHRLPMEESAAYYLTSRFGMIPTILTGALSTFLFPMASERHDRGQATGGLRIQALGGVLAVGLLVTFVLALIGPWLLNLFPAWREYVPYSRLLWKTALLTLGSSLISIYTLHETACRRFGFLWILVPVILIEIGALYSLMGWSFYRDLLPAPLWQDVNNLIRRDIDFVVHFMLAARVVMIGLLLVKLSMARRCYRS